MNLITTNLSRVFLLCILFFFLPYWSVSQRWEHYYGLVNRGEYPYDIIETYDKGYLICGGFNDLGTWLIKTDINGNVLWQKTAIADVPSTSFAMIQTSDTGYVIAGGIAGAWGFYDPMIAKLNACGEREWCRTFPGYFRAYDSWTHDIIETDAKDLVFIANDYGNIGKNPLFLIKLDSLGETKWKMPILTIWAHPTSIQPIAHNLIETPDLGYLITGHCYWAHPWDTTGEIKYIRFTSIKVNENGYEEWVYPFGLQDTILSGGNSSIILNENTFLGIGAYFTGSYPVYPLFINYNKFGNEVGYNILNPNKVDTLFITGNFTQVIQKDTVFICSGLFITSDEVIYISEAIIDTTILNSPLQVFNHVLHPNSRDPFILIETSDYKILN